MNQFLLPTQLLTPARAKNFFRQFLQNLQLNTGNASKFCYFFMSLRIAAQCRTDAKGENFEFCCSLSLKIPCRSRVLCLIRTT